MKKTPGQRIIDDLTALLETIERGDPISKQFTCRRVQLDLTPSTYDGAKIRSTRQGLRASQAIFARFLGVSPQTVRAWEQGVNTPNEMACRFMDEIRRDPEYWRKRLAQAIVIK